MVLAVNAMRKGDRTWTARFLTFTTALAMAFLVVKGFEWAEKFNHGLFPGSPTLLEGPRGEILFIGLYFIMTGLHALHIIIGIGLITTAFILTLKGRVSRDGRSAMLENVGLYWHLVDIIWIFLFPLFYLIA
jgi:cytochrome c oxidase subunit 3